MPEDTRGLSRRQVLAGLGTVGAAGGVAGAGTAAVLSDRERLRTRAGAGELDLDVEWQVLAGPGVGRSGVTSGRVDVPVAIESPDDAGVVEFELELPAEGENNAATVWLATDCPRPADTRLAGAIAATLTPVDPATGASLGPPLSDGSLRAVARDLDGGVRLDPPDASGGPCFEPGAPLGVRLEWSVSAYVGREATSLPLSFAARQCRHADPAHNPFGARGGGDCGTDACPCCLEVGRLELDPTATDQPGIGDAAVEPGSYEFTEGGDGYRLRVTETVDVPDTGETVAVAGRLLAEDGPAPPLCRIAVAGGGDPPGPDVRTYERASGAALSPSTASLSPYATGLVYAPERPDASGSRPHDPADYHGISHLTVAACPRDEGRCP